jgi:signal transduction histidine kinase/CheY-like chemotaxis protein
MSERRVLVLMPSVRDAERTVQMLSEAHVPSRVCGDLAELRAQVSRGAGALLLTQETLLEDTNNELGQVLRAQEPWSMIPLLLIVREHAPDSVERAGVGHYPGVTILEKPVRARALIGAVQSALRGRANQYQVRDLLRERERQSLELAAQDEKLRAALAVLSKQADQLRSTDKLKDQFLATLAHELRNPLAPITAGLSVLEAGGDRETVEHTLGIMRRQVNHMVRLIDDLLDVSRITTGKLELKMGRFTVRSAVDAAIEASMPSLDRGQQHLKLDIAGEDLHLHADQTRVAQMISNLLNNASKYTPSGGNIELSVRRDGDEVVISVRDDGIGIPPERLEDVFRMFEQVNDPLDRSQGGLGIGLALVRRLVEMHGGRVDAKSDGNGRGSTFTLRLPSAEPGPSPIAADLPTAMKPTNCMQRILIVDDNEDAGELLAFMLQQDGFEAVIAKDGPSALETAGAMQPNVVILDIGLPGMSGYEVAVKLRQDARHSNVSIIALTGWGSPEDKRRALEAGFDVHLTKPVFADDLRRAMSALKPSAPALSEPAC